MAKASLALSALSSAMPALSGSIGGSSSKPYSTSININGKEVASSDVKKQKISTSYNQSDIEKEMLDYTNQNILEGLKNINVFSDDVQKGIQNQVDAYTQQGLRTLNDNYTPMFRKLKSDIASRFGNLDNSIFMDNLNEIEKNRTDALENLTQNILAKQSELYQTEMNNRYNYLNQLSSVNKDLYSNMFNFLKIAASQNT